jgi:chaperonin GroEL (HSP60 family)
MTADNIAGYRAVFGQRGENDRRAKAMSTIAIGTVTVNAAFLQEIKEDDRHLHHLLELVAAEVNDGRITAGRLRRLVGLLDKLRDRLAMHFSLEEAYGYFEDAVSVAPHLSQEAETLRAEHQTLFVSVCDILEDAEQSLYHEKPYAATRGILVDLSDFLEEFRGHESRENELIVQALDDDLGVGD